MSSEYQHAFATPPPFGSVQASVPVSEDESRSSETGRDLSICHLNRRDVRDVKDMLSSEMLTHCELGGTMTTRHRVHWLELDDPSRLTGTASRPWGVQEAMRHH